MKVTVIGAGLGGLAVSCLLASKGHEVTVVEKNERPGGKIGEVRAQGFRFDTGPSLLTMPFILQSLFQRCGASLENYLHIEPLDPICRYFFKSGLEFDCHQRDCVNIAQIQDFAPEDVQAYRNFMAYSEKLYQRVKDSFLFNPLYGLSDLISLNWTDFLKIDAFKTVAQRIERQFSSRELQLFFKRFTTYNGSSPYQAPATMNVIPHVELNLGGHYIKGGIYRLVEALTKLAEKRGVTFKMNTNVENIVTRKGTVTGIADTQGHFYASDIVVSNADAYETYLEVLEPTDISKLQQKKIRETEPSGSGFVLLLGVNKTYKQLGHHNVFFSENYQREFDQIFNQKTMPDDPTIYVANTSYSDKDHAPEGASNLFILVNAPYLTEKWNWQKRGADYQNKIVRILENRGLAGLKKNITYSKAITPHDFYERYRSNKGSIYGTSSNSRASAFLRPHNKSRSVEGLYLVGGSTHPGGGIPLVILSALHATELIERYE
ncbi:MAG TPA: phytoene desaturase family protein [Fodinibius sp.]|nr:phytoene desaturase family protein [Fodinibius sp.]